MSRRLRAAALIGTAGAVAILIAITASVLAATAPATPDPSWRGRPARPARFTGDSVGWSPLEPHAAPDSSLITPPFSIDGRPIWRVATPARARPKDSRRPARAAPAEAPSDPFENGGLRRSFQLHRRASLSAIAGDSATAESCWTTLSRRASPWRWEATRALEDRALARGDTAAMAAFLGQRQSFRSVGEDAECQLYRARMQLTRRDSSGAFRTCLGLMLRYPAATPREALGLFDRVPSPTPRDSADAAYQQAAAAEAEFNLGNRDAAVRRLRQVFWPWARPSGRGNPFLDAGSRLGGMLQRSRRYPEALAVLDSVERFTSDSMFRASVALSRARALRDAGRTDSAFAEYRRAAVLMPATAWWESGRESEEQGRFADARDAYAALLRAGDSRGRLRLGLVGLAAVDRAQARFWFANDTSEAGRFWWAISSRDSARGSADSVLRILATRPGYDFYRTCARETLGMRARPVAASRGSEGVERDGAILFVRELVESGMTADAADVLERWSNFDREAGAPPGRPNVASPTVARLHAIELANACGRYRLALQMTLRVREPDPAAGEAVDSIAAPSTDFVPYAYPPHYSGLIDSLASDRRIGIERALLQALVWQESRFDSGAVSRAGAVGLTQLTPITVSTVAQRLRERTPPTDALTGARLNLRYGAYHLKQLLDRFQGRVPLALAAYNAGIPAAERWAKLAPGGGDALLCEMMAYTETREYVKNILAARQAYRDLKPYSIRP